MRFELGVNKHSRPIRLAFFALRSLWKDLYTICGSIYMKINSLPAWGAVGAGEIEVSAATLYTKKSSAHKRCFIRHYMKMTPKFSEDSRFPSEIQSYKNTSNMFRF